jgi:potassium-transporting ATPase KdpC subunit
MRSIGKQTLAAARVLVVLTVLLGILYPLGVWVVSRIPGLQGNAEGSVVEADGRAVGSDLIGIDPVAGDASGDPDNDPWFHTRPSATSSDELGLGPAHASTSLGSNKGAFDEDLVVAVKERKEIIAAREGVGESQVPPDAVTASGSGLDPDISPAYAELQAARVARVNGLSVDEVRAYIAEHTGGRGLGVLGEERVNVLTLNLAVQAAKR